MTTRDSQKVCGPGFTVDAAEESQEAFHMSHGEGCRVHVP
jgi:hypothetical protein